MGSRGPLPSARPRQRARDQRRREAAQIVLSGEGRSAPDLPIEVLPATQTWWETLWASPVSSQFRDIDLPGLVRVALLWEKVVERKASAAELGELRQLETSFGLTPAARVRLGWKFADELPESQSGTSAKTKTTRRRMRAV